MDNLEKLHMMEKMLRELEDITNSQTSLLKKISQLEADNINLGNALLDKRLPNIHEKVDDALVEATAVSKEFEESKDAFVKKHNLGEALPESNA